MVFESGIILKKGQGIFAPRMIFSAALGFVREILHYVSRVGVFREKCFTWEMLLMLDSNLRHSSTWGPESSVSWRRDSIFLKRTDIDD